MLRFSGCGVSDVGHRREVNEDAAYVAPYVCLVADGVGGAVAGEVASATAAYVVSATALARFGSPLPSVAREAAGGALQALREAAVADERLEGMATTLTAVLTDGREVSLVHVGDSRAYLWRAQTLIRLTRDHSYVQQLLDEGLLAPEAAADHPWSHVVARSLQSRVEVAAESVAVDVTSLHLVAGDRIVLCSDGVSDLVSERRMAEVLRMGLAGAAAILVELALEAGGRDNATAIVLDVVEGPRVVGNGQALGSLADLSNIVDPASVHL